MEKKLYFKNLDASRFFAFLLVFMAHGFITTDDSIGHSALYQSVYNWGKVGVLGLEYFFVLSAFLISLIILREKSESRDFNIPNFLIRRTLRVWPLYFLILFLGFLVVLLAPYLNLSVSPLPPWPYLIFFFVNFYIIDHGTEFLFFIAFLWSISIEEQFYLIWAFLMKFIHRLFPHLCLILILTSLIFRWQHLGQDASLYFHTISAFGNFGMGGLLAYAFHRKIPVINSLIHLAKWKVIGLYLLLFLSILFYHQFMKIPAFVVFERLYFSLLFAFVILEQSSGKNHWFEMGSHPAFNHLGKISYGLYCYHGLVITLTLQGIPVIFREQSYFHTFLLFPLFIFGVTFLVSHLSYRYFERPFLRLKDKFYTFHP